MDDNLKKAYSELLSDYWILFKRGISGFENTDAYWQELIHDANLLYEKHMNINKPFSYAIAIAIVNAIKYECVENNRKCDK